MLLSLLFSFNGRVNRRTFWIWNAFYYLIIVTSGTVINKLMPELGYYIFPVVLLLLVIPDLAVTAKRWHDRNKSAMWLLLNIPLVASRVMVPVSTAGVAGDVTMVQTVVSLSALICGAWIFIECGFMQGDRGDNQYGSPQA